MPKQLFNNLHNKFQEVKARKNSVTDLEIAAAVPYHLCSKEGNQAAWIEVNGFIWRVAGE